MKSVSLWKQYLNCKHICVSFRKCPTPIIRSYRLIYAANIDTGFRIFQVPGILTWDAFVRAPLMCGSRLLRVTDRENGVAKIVRGDSETKQEILQNSPISYSQINLQSLLIAYNLTDCIWITIWSAWARRKLRWRQKLGIRNGHRGLVRFLVLGDVNTAQKCPQLLLYALTDLVLCSNDRKYC